MKPEHELLQFFAFGHLPPHLRVVSEPFCVLANYLVEQGPFVPGLDLAETIRLRIVEWERFSPSNVEATWTSTKLEAACGIARREGDFRLSHHQFDGIIRLVLEAKDCAVRAVLYKAPGSAVVP